LNVKLTKNIQAIFSIPLVSLHPKDNPSLGLSHNPKGRLQGLTEKALLSPY
jgi:hypothetical protein